MMPENERVGWRITCDRESDTAPVEFELLGAAGLTMLVSVEPGARLGTFRTAIRALQVILDKLDAPTGGGGLSGIRKGRGDRLERVPRRGRGHR